MRGTAELFAVLSLLVIVGITPPSAPALAQSPSAQSSPPISIDRALFVSTVPDYAVIGANYTVKVLVRNGLGVSVPALVWIQAPVNSMVVRPLLIHTLVPARGQFLANFSLIPFHQPSSGHANVTAFLAVWDVPLMARPQVVQQLSTSVFSVTPSPVGGMIEVGFAAIVLLTLAGIYLYWRRSGRSEPAPPTAV